MIFWVCRQNYLKAVIIKIESFSPKQKLEGCEVKGVFLNISKHFDKVEHEAFIHKLNVT